MVYDKRTTFVRRDIEILSDEYAVDEFLFTNQPKWQAPFSLLTLFLRLLFSGGKYQVVMTQSAGYLSWAPGVLKGIGKFKVVIIAIGTDAARLPEIGYGHFCKSPLSTFTAASYRMADLILPVHKSLESDQYRYDDIRFPNQGFANLAGDVRTRVVEVVNGYRHKNFVQSIESADRAVSFLTVAVRVGAASYYRKGFDMVMELARRLPEHSFTIVSEFPRLAEVPPNVKVIENVEQLELVEIYNQHRFYLQLSMFEGFPNALCEAMLCGCIPIGSDVAGIPDIIGEQGYILKRKSPEMLEALVRGILSDGRHLELHPRQRILEHFPIERRARELSEQLTTLNTGS